MLWLINLNTQWCSLNIISKISEIFSESFSFIWIKLTRASNLVKITPVKLCGFIFGIYPWVKIHFFSTIWFEKIAFLLCTWICLSLSHPSLWLLHLVTHSIVGQNINQCVSLVRSIRGVWAWVWAWVWS